MTINLVECRQFPIFEQIFDCVVVIVVVVVIYCLQKKETKGLNFKHQLIISCVNLLLFRKNMCSSSTIRNEVYRSVVLDEFNSLQGFLARIYTSDLHLYNE